MDIDIDALPDDVREYITKLEEMNVTLQKSLGEAQKEIEERDELIKSATPEVREYIERLEEQVEQATELAKREHDARMEREFIEKAKRFEHLPVSAEEVGRLLKSVAAVADDETFDGIVELIEKADTALGAAEPWAELGSSLGADTATSSELDKIAKAYADEHEMTVEQAMVKVLEDNPDLYNRYLSEQGG